MCVQLARMGCVVFHYDMIGYADSQQLSFDLAHRFAKQRPEMDTPDNWGFYSPQAELRHAEHHGLANLQLGSRARLVQPVARRRSRIGSASPAAAAAARRRFILCAIDPRPAAAFPAVMVSTAMQGGCTCENCSLLRVGTGNIEFAAMIAPRPLGMTGANDWTKEIDTKGFPELKQHYAMLGVPDKVLGQGDAAVRPQLQLRQPRGDVSVLQQVPRARPERTGARRGLQTAVGPRDDRLGRESPAPARRAATSSARCCGRSRRLRTVQIAALEPRDSTSLAKFREIVGGGVDVLIGRKLPADSALEYEPIEDEPKSGYRQYDALLRNVPAGEELPLVILHPKDWNKRVVIWVHENGKAGLYDSDGQPTAAVRKLLDAGAAVIGADLLYQGEFLADGKPLAEARRVSNPREFAGYTLGYNSALPAQRAHDILTLVAFARTYADQRPQVDLVGLGIAGVWAAAARAQAGGAIDRAAIDTDGFRFTSLRSIRDVNFLPGAAKYGDMPAMLALSAPARCGWPVKGRRRPNSWRRPTRRRAPVKS